jgi:hypothetical protein
MPFHHGQRTWEGIASNATKCTVLVCHDALGETHHYEVPFECVRNLAKACIFHTDSGSVGRASEMWPSLSHYQLSTDLCLVGLCLVPKAVASLPGVLSMSLI